MSKWIAPVTLFAVALGWIGAIFLATGCAITDYVPVDVPRHIQQTVGVPPRVSLTEAPEVLADYKVKVEQNVVTMGGNIEDKRWVADLFGTFVDYGVDMGTLAIGNASLPGATIGIAGLFGLGGILTGRLTNAKAAERVKAAIQLEAEQRIASLQADLEARTRKEKEKSYNSGLEKAAQIVRAGAA